MKTLAVLIFSIALHLTLGWEWTVLAGLAGGLWAFRGGWRVGALGVLLGWGALVVWNFVVAAEPMGRMVETFGGLMGNVPGWGVVAATLLLGGLLGLLGGAAGTALRGLIKPPVAP
jgi:hypothetical protein